jgi:hypothetical protein
MRTIQLESEVGADGVLHLAVPVGSAQANSRVIVTIEPLPQATASQPGEHLESESMYGSCAGLGLEEPPDLPLPRIVTVE